MERGRNVNRASKIEDLQKMAISRLQRIVDDFLEGSINDELGIAVFLKTGALLIFRTA